MIRTCSDLARWKEEMDMYSIYNPGAKDCVRGEETIEH